MCVCVCASVCVCVCACMYVCVYVCVCVSGYALQLDDVEGRTEGRGVSGWGDRKREEVEERGREGAGDDTKFKDDDNLYFPHFSLMLESARS